MRALLQIRKRWIVLLLAAACTVLSFPRSQLASATRVPDADKFRTFLFGVDYYPEQWPESMWDKDAQRMQDAGVNAVRIAEFGWSVMESSEGNYDFTLYDRAIEVLGRHGIRVILGTPTATPPKWLTHDYPEVLYVFPDGRKSNDQTRRHYCYTSPLYRKFSRQIVEEMAKHYRDNSNVIGWQIDNEFNNENPECFSDNCRIAFRRWLEAKYGTFDTLNERWGNRFWSQWYTSWEQIDLPFPATSLQNPALMLDFKRFISDSVSSYMAEQIAIIRKYRPDDFITTNGVFRNINFYSFAKPLDLYAVDNYPTFGDAPQYPVGASLTQARSFNGRMMVMEELTGPAGQTYLLRSPRPGEMNLWAFQTIAHGADGVLHFRWRTARRGAEEYWSGVLDQENIPGARYDEFKKEGSEIRAIGSEILGSKIVSQIAILNDFEAGWNYEQQYLSRDFNSGVASTVIFQAASEAKHNIDFIGPNASFSNYKIIFAPRLVFIDPETAARIRQFVESGGIFIVAARSALFDRDNALIGEPRPALLSGLFGVEVSATQMYKATTPAGNSIELGGNAIPAEVVAEGLRVKDAHVLGTWTNDFLRGAAAYTERSVDKGKAVYYGSFINLAAARAILGRYAVEAGLKPLLSGVPQQTEVTCRSTDSADYFFVLNHENRSVRVSPGEGYFDLLQKKPAATAFELGPFQYSVLKKDKAADRKRASADVRSRSSVAAKVQR